MSDGSSDVCSSVGRRRVLDDLHEVVLVDHLARRQGDVLAELEGLDVGHLDPEAALAALEVGEQVVQALHEVLAAGFQRRAQHLRIGHHEVGGRSEEHTSELQSLMRSSYAVFCLKKKKKITNR